MGKPQIITSPSGENLVVLSQEDYEELVDSLAALRAKASFEASGRQSLAADEVGAYLDAATPLAFWRKKRGLTQTALATSLGTSQGYIADLEAGRRKGDSKTLKELAKALDVRMEDLIVEE